jgi:hypothetical protein
MEKAMAGRTKSDKPAIRRRDMTYQNNVSLATNIVAFVVVPDDRRLTD